MNLEDANKNDNKILIVFADCAQLRSWRIGELSDLNDYGYVMVPKSLINTKIKMSKSRYLFEMRKLLEKNEVAMVDENQNRVRKTIERHFPLLKLNETKILGIISQDTNALYWGLIQNLQTDKGTSKNVVGMMAMSLIKGKTINFYLWKKYEGDRTLYDLEGLTSSWVRYLST